MVQQYDLHIHTEVSPCSGNSPEEIVEAAINRGLDGIAVTDHDTVVGARQVADVAPSELEVIIGAEITTSQGHLLALDINEAPDPGVDPLDAIEFVHDQDGVAVLAHPFDELRQTYSSSLEALATAADGIEVKNSRCLLSRYNKRARAFAEEHNLPVTGGSDGHFPKEIGRAVTISEGPMPEAIRNNHTTANGDDRYISGHMATKLYEIFGFDGMLRNNSVIESPKH